ncbi:MAG: hypothetical protein KGL01_03970, partial [Betaproteobacteria bacterium]|nr:hypothetical protein [Betaproteobacteria bacterium]
MANAFFYEFKEDLNAFDSEPCIIVFNDGHELEGELTSFSPEEDMLEVLSTTGAISKLKLQFVDYIHLANPVHLKKKAGLIDETHEVVFGAPKKQSCLVLFTNGKKLEGKTVDFVVDKL